MRYDQHKAAHIPRASGTTDAACKMVFTQRLKLSDMRWSEEGAQRILTLRTTLLSKHWGHNYQKHLDGLSNDQPRAYVSINATSAA